MPFVKLDCGIVNSTLWADRDSREVFITSLLMAVPYEFGEPQKQIEVSSLNYTGFEAPPGWYGFVEAAGPGIIRQAGLDPEAGYKALERLGSPDLGSRTPHHDGRRMIRIDGGYLILNYMNYRDKDYTAAERMRRLRERRKAEVTRNVDGVTRKSDVADSRVQIAETNSKEDKKPLTRPQDELWESLMEACGIDSRKRTKSESGAWNKACKELKDAGATPRVIQGRARAFRKKWPEATLTPTALARRWNECIADNGGANEM